VVGLFEELQKVIDDGKVIAIVGSGVSLASKGGNVLASWAGLLKDGIARCQKFRRPMPAPGWDDRQRAALDHGRYFRLLGEVERPLAESGEYAPPAPNRGSTRWG
jgi:hypothetical protein